MAGSLTPCTVLPGRLPPRAGMKLAAFASVHGMLLFILMALNSLGVRIIKVAPLPPAKAEGATRGGGGGGGDPTLHGVHILCRHSTQSGRANAAFWVRCVVTCVSRHRSKPMQFHGSTAARQHDSTTGPARQPSMRACVHSRTRARLCSDKATGADATIALALPGTSRWT